MTNTTGCAVLNGTPFYLVQIFTFEDRPDGDRTHYKVLTIMPKDGKEVYVSAPVDGYGRKAPHMVQYDRKGAEKVLEALNKGADKYQHWEIIHERDWQPKAAA